MAETLKQYRQPWLADPLRESLLILAPAFLPVAVIVLFHDYFQANHEVSTVWWVVLVLGIDVSHVYSTLFRLYWDRPTFQQYKRLLIIIPVAAFVVGFLLHFYSAGLFWRILAYIAVYHFVRQQYGFMRLYSRQEQSSRTGRLIETIAIYNATLYPLVYWHIHLTESLSWFVAGDFIPLPPLVAAGPYLRYLFVAILLVYTLREINVSIRHRFFNIPKNLIVYGTYCSWYAGIVWFEGDLIFTLLNVVAHGIPYMGLIWIHGEKKASGSFSFSWKGVAIFAGVLLLLAYLEESVWDVFVWKDHAAIFPFLVDAAPLEDPLILSLLVPLLVLPQVTHYVLDGFIWRFSRDRHARV
jgi:hypothetical protein